MTENCSVWTVDESRAHDKRAQEWNIELSWLMETAGSRAAYCLIPELSGPGLVMVGKGHNGGDGLVVARHLARYLDVSIVMPLGRPSFPRGENLLQAAVSYGAKVVDPTISTGRYHWVIDGVFGTGFHGTVDHQEFHRLWQEVSKNKIPLYALDILSGIDADSGAYDLESVYAAKTLTFGAAKWGHFTYPGSRYGGQLVVLDIGLPDMGSASGYWLNPSWARRQMSFRDFYTHKYRQGTVAVVGGSDSMPGAPVLAGSAALKAGAGLVELFVPEGILNRIQAPTPLLARGIRSHQDAWSFSSEDMARLQRANVIIVGPGLGPHLHSRLLREMSSLQRPLVVDADALRLLGEDASLTLPVGSVLTPHAGEMGRLLEKTSQEVDGFRYRAVIEAASRFNVSVILKGPFSLTGAREVFVNTTNTPALATAGSGDVLSGIVAALLAHSDPASYGEQLALATYLHGWAGIWAERHQGLSVVATDIIGAMSKAWNSIEQGESPPFLPISR